MSRSTVLVALILLGSPSIAEAQTSNLPDEELLSSFTYRNMSPFRMGARIAGIAVPDTPARDHRFTIYVAPWTGGIFKTTNNGTTWEPIFDNVSRRLTVGAVEVAHNNADIVWAGTGDAFTSRSSYAGDGAYKSTDAGATWQHMGLDDTHHIARIRIHPTDPDIVYVAAMGHLYSNNPERGVYRTRDGGRSWEKVLYINERVGVIDLDLNLQDPDVLYAATFDKQRYPHKIVSEGPESAIYKTTDGGDSWTRLSGGLPSGQLGRIGISIVRNHPNVVYALIANNNLPAGAEAPTSHRERQPIIGGEVYRSTDAGATWTKTSIDNVSTKGPYYFNQIFADANDDMTVFVTGDPGGLSRDGGRTWGRIFRGHFGDNRTFWFDPEDSDRMILGSDGSIAISYDGGRTGDSYDNIPLGEIYMVGIDMDDPYNIYAGLQDHEHWRAPSTSAFRNGITQHEWFALGDGDGMYVEVDQTDSRWLYVTRHYGGHTRLDQRLGYETSIVPQTPPGEEPYRWQWTAPIEISPHDPAILYTGGQKLLESTDRGDHWFEISPDLSTNDPEKDIADAEGYGPPGGIPWFAISTISESPLEAGVIWAGLSDGKVWVTRDGGGAWSDETDELTALGARESGYVSRVRASSHAAGRAYVSKRAYKFDDFRPFLYKTEDYGESWTSISDGLPQEPINVVFEDPENPDLLYVGNDVGVFVSLDRGGHWVNFNNNMPNVPVHDLVVHPREGDLVLGSYGRGIWVANVRALQQLTPDVLASDAHLFTVKPTVQRVTWSFGANDYLFGQRYIQTPNEPNGVVIDYYLKNAADDVSLTVTDSDGQEVWSRTGPGTAGINTVVWGAGGGRGGGRRGGGGRGVRRGGVAAGARGRGAAAGGGRGGRGGGLGGRGRGAAPPVDPATRMAVNDTPTASAGGRGGSVIDRLPPLGDYTVTLEVDGRRYMQPASIVGTQGWAIGPSPQIIR